MCHKLELAKGRTDSIIKTCICDNHNNDSTQGIGSIMIVTSCFSLKMPTSLLLNKALVLLERLGYFCGMKFAHVRVVSDTRTGERFKST